MGILRENPHRGHGIALASRLIPESRRLRLPVDILGAVAATAGMASHEQGLASGLWNTAPQIGSAFGLAVLVSVAQLYADGTLPHLPGMTASTAAAWLTGFKAAFIAAAGIVAVGLWSVLAWVNKPNRIFHGREKNNGIIFQNAQPEPLQYAPGK